MRTDNRARNFPPTFAALQEMWDEREQGYRQERERMRELLREAYMVLVCPIHMEGRDAAAEAVAGWIRRQLDASG